MARRTVWHACHAHRRDWSAYAAPHLVADTSLPTVVANTLIIPFVLAYAYHAEEGIPFMMLTVGIGEVISAYVLGIALYFALRKNARYLFKNTQQ